MLPKRICAWLASGLSTRRSRRAETGSGAPARVATASGRGRQAPTERIDRSRQRLRREGSRAAAEGGGRQRGEPGLTRWILSCAGADHDVELDERQLVILGDDQAKPIVEGRSPDRRELVRPAATGSERHEQSGDAERRLHRTAPPVGMRSPPGPPPGTGA